MLPTFSNNKKNYEANDDETKTLSPYKSSLKWAMESFFLDIYFLLVHRIKGLGLSLNDFWQWDTWTTSMFYCRELELIDKEEDAMNDDKDSLHDSEDMKDLYEEMWGDDEV